MTRRAVVACIVLLAAAALTLVWLTPTSAHPFEEAPRKRADGERKPFIAPDSPHRYPRSRDIDITHIELNVELDIERMSLSCVERIAFTPLRADLTAFELDGVELVKRSVECKSGRKVSATDLGSGEGRKSPGLAVRLDTPMQRGDSDTLQIVYEVTEPKGGIHFVGPDECYPEKPIEVWTQGQTTGNRNWFYCFDDPSEFQTTELILTVPKGLTALSNGKLESVSEDQDTATWHWVHDVPHASYLVMFAVGDFVEIKDGLGELPIGYYCHAGEEKLALNLVRRTPHIIACFEKAFGTPYPYAKYAQIFLHDFMAGGMENTSATVLARRFMHDDRAHLDVGGENIVAHELAHQWFGDLVTCRDWGEIWLNEGFATYGECLWAEHSGGSEEYQRTVYSKMKAVIDEDARYRRPLSTNRYYSPWQMFDATSYQKGAIVLHMLRDKLGDEDFFETLRHYLETNRGKPVVSADFAKAITEATGFIPDRFFDEWVFGAGHPEFKYSWVYNEADGDVTVAVEQIQSADENTAAPFACVVDVAASSVKDDRVAERKSGFVVFDEKASMSLTLHTGFRPDFITFDVGNDILDVTSLADIPDQELKALLLYEPDDIAARLDAANELGKRNTEVALEGLVKAMSANQPWFIREAAIKALPDEKLSAPACLDALIEALKDPHPKVRRAAVKALGRCKGDEKAGTTLLAKAEFGDASYFVEAESFEALGNFEIEGKRELLLEAYGDRDSHQEVIRVACLSALAQEGNTEDIKLMMEAAKVGNDEYLRAGAASALGTLGAKLDGEDRAAIRTLLIDLLNDSGSAVVLGAAQGLKELRDPETIPALEAALREIKGKRSKDRIESIIDSLKREGGER